MKMAATVSHLCRRYMAKQPQKGGKQVVVGPSGVYPTHEGGFKIFRTLSCFVAFPIIAAVMVHCYLGMQEHEPRPEFIKYEYMRRRTKRFPWGDGNHSLFHNPHTNPLPDGYEDD